MRVQRFVLDLEGAAWKSIRKVWPGIYIKGCLYHWSKNVWKRIGLAGLKVRCNNIN